MPPTLQPALDHLRQFLDAQTLEQLSDSQLLDRYVHRRDEAAFAGLMRRHSGLVLGVCRRILPCWQDAEDAFQATFLVFARKAASIIRQDSVAGWLHQVAQRLAQRHRYQQARRQEREQRTVPTSTAEPMLGIAWRELQAVLDTELARLPAKYRQPLLLCYLEGKSHEETARHLGWPVGTVRTRLARGRDQLRQRLVRRGLTLSAEAFAAAVAVNSACAAVPTALLERTLVAAQCFAAGQVIPAASSAGAVLLAEQGLRTMARIKLALVMSLLLALGVLAAGGSALLSSADGDPAVYASQPFDADSNQDAAAQPPPPRTDSNGDPLPEGAIARLGTTRLTHGGPVNAVAFAPNANHLASASDDRTVRLWDPATGQELRLFAGHTDKVRFVAFSPDGKKLASISPDNTVRLWDVATGKELRQLPGGNRSSSVSFSPDSKVAAYASWDGGDTVKVYLLECASGKVVRHLGEQPLGAGVLSALFSPDGKTFACRWSQIPGVALYEVESGKELRVFPCKYDIASSTGAEAQAIAFSPDGKLLASGASNDRVHLWDATSGEVVRTLDVPNFGNPAVAFSPDGKMLATARHPKEDNEPITLWEVSSGKMIRQFGGSWMNFRSLCFSADGTTLATASSANRIQLWDVATGKLRLPSGGHQDQVNSVAWSPDGETVASAGWDATVRLWDVVTRKELRQLDRHKSSVHAVHFSPDGKFIASGSYFRPLSVQDVTGAKEPRLFGEEQNGAGFVRFSPDGKVIASGRTDATICLWNSITGKEVRSLNVKGASAMAFSPDGLCLASSASREKIVQLWDLAGGKEIRTFAGPQAWMWAVAFSPDGKLLVAGGSDGNRIRGDHAVHIWEAASAKPLFALEGHEDAVRTIAFAPDGRTIASAGDDRTIRLWEVHSGKQRCLLQGHQGPVTSLAFSPDGRSLVTGSADGTLLIWNTHSKLPARGTAISAQEMTALWNHLIGDDAEKAHRAVVQMAADPQRTAPFLRSRLRPVPRADQRQIGQLIADLESSEFATRQKAHAELEKLGEQAEPALNQALAGKPSLDVRQRIDKLLESLQRWPIANSELLRSLRAIEVLEICGSSEAHRGLQMLASGAPEARVTREAKAALDRFEKGRR
jgi:RNA polymerase sigma factor (sigma-70 family)